MAGETGKASRCSARKVVRLEKYSKSTPSRRNGSKATAYGGGSLLTPQLHLHDLVAEIIRVI
jgi:hypothetical protein